MVYFPRIFIRPERMLVARPCLCAMTSGGPRDVMIADGRVMTGNDAVVPMLHRHRSASLASCDAVGTSWL